MHKYKPVHDAEFNYVRLVPAEDGRNLDTFAAIELEMEDGRLFRCSGISDEKRLELFENPPPKGTSVTVEYGDLSEDGVPIFPRFKDVRWDQ